MIIVLTDKDPLAQSNIQREREHYFVLWTRLAEKHSPTMSLNAFVKASG